MASDVVSGFFSLIVFFIGYRYGHLAIDLFSEFLEAYKLFKFDKKLQRSYFFLGKK